MKKYILIIVLFLFLLIATLSGFELATVSTTEKILGLTKPEWLIVHTGSGSIFILLVLIYIIVYRKWIINTIKKIVKVIKSFFRLGKLNEQ